MSTNLVKYNAARIALAEAHAVDEVKDIRDKAEAMAAYARQAKDTEMIAWVTEIKVRAERRAGEMLASMEKRDGGHAAKLKARSHDVTEVPKTLSDLGISKNESSRWQKLAAVSDEQFEHAVAAAKDIAGEVTTAAMLRAAKQDDPPKPAPAKPEPEPQKPDELTALRQEFAALREFSDQQGQTIKELLAEAEEMSKAFEADDAKVSLLAENKKLREMIRVLEERNRGMQNEVNAAKRAAQAWQRKYEKALKAA